MFEKDGRSKNAKWPGRKKLPENLLELEWSKNTYKATKLNLCSGLEASGQHDVGPEDLLATEAFRGVPARGRTSTPWGQASLKILSQSKNHQNMVVLSNEENEFDEIG